MQLPSHGANPHSVYERLGMIPPENVVDFSENVNPAGPPPAVVDNWVSYLELVTKYPNPNGEPFLSKVAAFHRVVPANIVLGNGASELFAVLARRYTGKRVILVHPTFSEYEATLTVAGADLVHLIVDDIVSWSMDIDEVKRAMVGADALYICTPNNPTGVLPSRSVLAELMAYGRAVGCELVLDEAFIDWVDEATSFIPFVSDNPHVIVVRSMTKMYAIPGIRLGYLIAGEEICEELRAQMPHWHINGLAAVIGAACLDSVDYANVTIAKASGCRERVIAMLRGYGCIVSDSVTNYVAFRLPNVEKSAAFFRFCLVRGVVLRHSENFKGMNGEWFRIGIKQPAQMALFERVLNDWFRWGIG